MKPEFIELIGNARKRKGEKFRNQLTIFIICLVLSVFLWALVRLSRDYYHSIEYRLSFSEVPWNMKIVSVSDTIIALKIKVQGYEFFSSKLMRDNDLTFDVSLKNIRIRNRDNHFTGYITTNRIGREIAAQTNFPSEVFVVTPDTLFFEFEKPVIRKVPSKPASPLVQQPGQKERDSMTHRMDSILNTGKREKSKQKAR